MIKITLMHQTPEGSRAVPFDGDRLSFGRGSEADQRVADEGLSRLNSIIYRDGSRVWIVDQNSTNGTFVNDAAVAAAGTPLRSGDRIRMGNHTVLTVMIEDIPETKTAAPANVPQVAISSGSPPSSSILPVVLIAGAVLVISLSAVFIGYAVLAGSSSATVNTGVDDDPPDIVDGPGPKLKATPAATPDTSVSATPMTGDIPIDPTLPTQTDVAPGKKYADMSDAERRQYLAAKAMRIAQVIGNNSSEQIPPSAVSAIKSFADAYASRARVKPLGGCRFGDNLQATYERASKDAPFIVRAFNEKGIDPRIGLYLAMIESEHCICLQSPTGPLGMFQFTRATAELHGLKVFAGASTTNPDERCQPEPAARAAASYMKALTGRYGTGPASVPLAIGSYNSGEGGLSTNLEKALSSNSGLPRDFWTLIANGEKLSKQFQAENFKYVPKFFAAAIVGENPQDFGLSLQPISTYTK
jgi:Transglycosylase SLT domain/Inner membrane component of T3SS, cytoplasmic domain